MTTRYRPTFIAVLLACVIPLHAHSVQLGENGVGEVLVFPFFNANMGWDTYLDLTFYSGDTPQMVKIHVRDDINGDITNSFNLYQLYSHPSTRSASNWRAAITRDSQGNPILRVAEGPCTVSDDGIGGEAGSSFPLGASVGSIEVYAVSSRLIDDVSESAPSCDEIAERWEPQGIWQDDPDADLVQIGSGYPFYGQKNLSGLATVINVDEGLSASYSPLAFVDFADQIPHSAPSADFPNLADANPIAISPEGTEFIPNSGEGIDAVAFLLAASLGGSNTSHAGSGFYDGYAGQLTNQVIQSEAIGAITEWVLSYPLDGYKPYRPFEVSVEGEPRRCETLGTIGNTVDYTSPLIEEQAEAHESVSIGFETAVNIVESWGGGRKFKFGSLDLAPLPPVDAKTAICFAVNVLGFEEQDSILIKDDSPNLYRLRNSILANPESSTLRWHIFDPEGPPEISRPVVGFRLTVFKNGTLNGGSTLANYAILQPHYSH